jgi:hypothetical protein
MAQTAKKRYGTAKNRHVGELGCRKKPKISPGSQEWERIKETASG